MQSNHFFYPKRFWFNVRKDFIADYGSRLIEFTVLAGLVTLLSGVAVQPTSTGAYRFAANVYFFFALFFAGFSYSIKSLHTPLYGEDRGFAFLQCPASTGEKLLSRILLSSIVWVAVSIIAFGPGYLVAKLFNHFVFERELVLSSSWFIDALKLARHYLILNAVFVFAGVVFKKFPMPKLIAIIIGLAFLSMILLQSVFMMFINSVTRETLNVGNPVQISDAIQTGLSSTMKSLAHFAKWFYWIALAPLFWVLSYVRLRKVEV